MKKGVITGVSGPVVDVMFNDTLPKLKDALEVVDDGAVKVMEVAQHLDDKSVRCIMLSGSEGLRRGMSVGEMGQADREMSELTGRLFAVAENYPELRSSEVFLELQRGIRDAEEHLQAARRLYNANVSSYNIAIAMFPAKLLAGGHSPKEFYDADDEKRDDVKMRF